MALKQVDKALRPVNWDSYIGQQDIKNRLQVQIQAAKERGERLGHILLIGPAGSGKSSLGALIAEAMGVEFLSIMITPTFNPDVISRRILEADRDLVILLDEIHLLPRRHQHVLYSILEDNVISFSNGKSVPIEHAVTIIAATTEPQDLTKSLFDRFDIHHLFSDYSDEEMADIVAGFADQLGLYLTDEECEALGRASAGTPRQARKLVLAARDLGDADPQRVFELCGITEDGLTEDHVSYLRTLHALGGTAGIDNLASHSGRPKEVILDAEKLLVKRRFIEIAKKGRTLMMPGLKALKKADPEYEFTSV